MVDQTKEVDKDLTMLTDTEPTVAQKQAKALEGADVSRSVYVGPELKTESDAKDYVQGLRSDAAILRSTQEGSRDSSLDVGRSIYESVDSARARNQNEGIKGLKAIGGGVLQGGLVALEQAGYVADMDTYTNMFAETEDLSGNWWTRLMKDSQEAIGQSETFKIYEEEPDSNSIASQIFKWTSLESAISSSVGFGISGLGAAKLVSALGSMKKFKAIGNAADAALGMAGGSTKAFAGPLASSVTSNFFMGQMMATDTYNVAMEHLEPRIGDEEGQMTRLEAQKIANNEAQEVVKLNMALTATAYLKFGSIFKRRRTNVMIKDPTFGRQALDLIKKGSPTAFGENVYQEMIQMEQIHDADVEGDTDYADEYKEDFWGRATELMLSNRAVHAGALGVVGGPIQFALIQRPMMGKQIAQQREDFKSQQERLTIGGELAKNNFETFRKYDGLYKKAVKRGDLTEAKLIEESHLIHEVAKQIEWGTIDSLRNDIEKIAKAEKDDPNVKDFDSDYSEKASDFLKMLDSAEKYMGAMNGKANLGGLTYNRLVSQQVDASRVEVTNRIKEDYASLEKLAAERFPNREFDISSLEFTDLAENRFEGLSEAQKNSLKTKESKESQELMDFLNNREEFTNIEKDIKRIKKFDKLSKNLFTQFEKLYSDEGQAQFIKEQQEGTANFSKNAETTVETTKQDKAKEEQDKNWSNFQTIKHAKVNISQEELQTMNSERAETVKENITKGIYADLRDGESFTSIDKEGVVRTFSPHDIYQAVDGRLFNVKAQNKASMSSNYAEMPIIYEVEFKNGSYVKAGKLTVLEENNFLRHGVLQAYLTADGKYRGHQKEWKSYRTVDTVMKPNNFSYNTRRVENAADGIVNSVNIHESNINKKGFEWMSKYNMDLINKPFTSPYDITLKLNSDYKNNTLIDVYAKTDQGEILLTRLSRDYNLAHEDLIKMLVKGENVTGSVINHYSSAGNFSKNRDSSGNIIYTPLSSFKNVNSSLLINGSLVIAQWKGNSPRVFENRKAARALDGTIYDSDYINVEGYTDPKVIPYEKMTPGDTYALLMGVSGEIVPISLRGSSLANIPSRAGLANKAADVLMDWQDSVDELMAEEIANEVAYDKEDLEKAQTTNKPGLGGRDTTAQQKLFKKYKRARAIAKDDTGDTKDISEFWGSFQKSVLQHIKYYPERYIKSYKEDGTERYETSANGKKLINPDYLKPTIDVSTSTAKYVPALEVFDPKNPTRYRIINPVDHAEDFKKILGGRRSKASIDILHNTELSNASEAMEQYVEESGFVSDINLNKVFVGSSVTIQLDGADIKYGASEAAKLKKMNDVKFKKNIDKLDKFVADTSEATLAEFNKKIDEVLSPDAIDFSMEVISENATADEVIKNFLAIPEALGIIQFKDAQDLIRKAMEDTSPDKSEELQDVENTLTNNKLVKPQFIPLMAKGIIALQEIQQGVPKGEFSLESVSKTSIDNKYIQVEGIAEFGRHAQMFHKVHGIGEVRGTNIKNGLITMKFKNNEKGVSIYPSDLYLVDGPFHRIVKLKKSLLNVDKGTLKYDTISSQLAKAESYATYLKRKAYKEEVAPIDEGTTSTAYSMVETAKALTNSRLTKTFTDLAGNSARSSNIAKGLENFVELRAKVPMNLAFPIALEFIDQLNTSWLDAVPYTTKELSEFVELLEDNIKKNIDADVNEQRLSHVKHLQEIVAALEPNTNLTSIIEVSNMVYKQQFKKYKIANVVLPSTLHPSDSSSKAGAIQETSIDNMVESTEELAAALANVIIVETEVYADRFKVSKTPNAPAKISTKTPGVSAQQSTTEHVERVMNNIVAEFENIKGFTEDGKVVELDKDFKWYINKNDKDASGEYVKYSRVTDLMGSKPFETAKLKSSQVIGTKIDNLIRDFFKGTTMAFDSKYGIKDKSEFDEFISTLNEFKKSIAGQTVLAEGVVLFDKVTKRAGTVDLITYDQKGTVRIFDIKTMLYDPRTGTNYDSTVVFEPVIGVTKADGSQKFQVVKGRAQDSSRIKHQKQLSAYRIILNNTYGLLAEELFVTPIKVDYQGGDTVATTASFLRSIKMTPLDKVGDLILDESKSVRTSQQAKPSVIINTPDGTVIRKNNMVGLGTKPKAKPADVAKPAIVDDATLQPYLEMLVDNYGVTISDATRIAESVDTVAIKNLLSTMELLSTSDPMFDSGAFVDKFMNDKGVPPFKLASKEDIFTNEDFQTEVDEVAKLLPKVPLNVVEDVAYMYKKFGANALGAYNLGTAYVVKGSKAGTVYHEAFHAVADLYLTSNEKEAMAQERGEKEWSLPFEEKLAEEFEEFKKTYKKQTFFDKVSKFFASIIDWAKGTRSIDVTEKVFSKIMDGGYAKSPSKAWFKSSLNGIQSQEEFMSQLSDKNNVILQRLREANKIKIVC